MRHNNGTHSSPTSPLDQTPTHLPQFTTPLPAPTVVYICHCTLCRHQSSSAFGISAIFPKFSIETPNADSLRMWSRPALSGKTMRCYFCDVCGSRLVHARDGLESVSVKGGCLRGLSREMVAGAVHIWVAEAVVEIPDGVERFDGEPPDD